MQQSNARTVVYAGLVAAAYTVLTLALAPISFGPLQLRVSTLIVPIVLLDKKMAAGVAVGVALSNLMSPFGWYDWLIMPLVSYASYMVGWQLRSIPPVAIITMSAIVAAGVAMFPLHMGAGIPVVPTAFFVFASILPLMLAGWYIIWRNIPVRDENWVVT